MKVYEGQIPVLPGSPKDAQKKAAGESDFQKIMDQARVEFHKKEQSPAKGVTGPVESIQLTSGPDHVVNPGGISERKELIRELQTTLDLVDFYAVKLADSKLATSAISPLVSHLEDRLEVMRNMESNPGLPDKLRPVIADMVITIGTEIAKFRRGDYSEHGP